MGDVRVSFASLIAKPFHRVHNDIKHERHREYWMMGGRGSTKSSFISLEIVLGVMKNPGANAVVFRKYAEYLKKSVYSQITWATNKLGVTELFRFLQSPMEIVYKPTGQKIIFSGADKPERTKSFVLPDGYVKYLWFEELTEFSGMDDVRTIKPSVFRGGDHNTITFYSYNPPQTQRNWVNEEALKQREDRLKHHSSYLDVPAEWLGKDFIAEAEALRDTNDRAYRHTYLGEVTGTGGAVFENVVTRPVTDEEIKTFGATYAGLDFGWYPDPLHFARCAHFPASKRLVIYDEYRALKQRNDDAFRALVADKGLKPGEEVVADSSEPKSVSDMRAHGMWCTGATKGPGSVAASMKWLQGLREIVIDPVRCPHTAKEFLEYEYERDRTGEVVAGYPDKDNHAIDAVRYALNRVWLVGGE